MLFFNDSSLLIYVVDNLAKKAICNMGNNSVMDGQGRSLVSKVISIWDRKLEYHQAVGFFLVTTSLFVLPLILADFRYIDDNWRTLEAGNGWAAQGRWFTDLLYKLLSFSDGAPDIFPLPLLFAILAISLALARLTFWFFSKPTILCCLVPLPLWYNPFLLQNLSYQYDGPSMVLSLVAVIYAVAFRDISRLRQWCAPVALLVLAFGLYQISVNVFLGLCCVEMFKVAYERMSWRQGWEIMSRRVAQFGLACPIYLILLPSFRGAGRAELLNWNAEPLLQVSINIGRIYEKVSLLFNGGGAWISVVLFLFSLVGVVRLGCRRFVLEKQKWKAVVMSLVCMLMFFLLLLLVPGITLFFREFNENARTLMGFGVLMTLLFYLAYIALVSIHSRLPLLLVIPLLATLSLSFAYGRVLTLQKTSANGALYNLGYDVLSRRELYDAKRIYMAEARSEYLLVSGCGSFKQYPVLRYLLNINFFVLWENFRLIGVLNVVPETERRNATLVGYQGYTPIVDNKYYQIYKIGDYGLIFFKEQVWNELRGC